MSLLKKILHFWHNFPTSLFLMLRTFSVRMSSCSSSLRLARSDDPLSTPPEGRGLIWKYVILYFEWMVIWDNIMTESPVRDEDEMTEVSLPRGPPLGPKLLDPLGIFIKRIWVYVRVIIYQYDSYLKDDSHHPWTIIKFHEIHQAIAVQLGDWVSQLNHCSQSGCY